MAAKQRHPLDVKSSGNFALRNTWPELAWKEQPLPTPIDVNRMSNTASRSPLTLPAAESPSNVAIWSVVAAFGAYFCMYAFRKPFTSAAFDHSTVWGLGEKSILVVAQVLGYMVSKFIGIRIIAEMKPERRVIGILGLIGFAEASLLLFAIVPSPYHIVCLFLNGLPLGMVYGLVLGFLEGRRHTEALTAGLCASFILADGATKSIGSWLLHQGFSERWMPCCAGLVFVPPLLLFVWMLSRINPPTAADIALRSERVPMTRADRNNLLRRYALGILALVVVYLLVTILRSVRADFAKELWGGLGQEAAPSTFTSSEILVALGVLAANGSCVLIQDNRRAFFTSIGVSLFGIGLLGFALLGLELQWLDGFSFMVLSGLGLYLPYVAVHTTVFERMIAMTRERGNMGFLMYVADAIGYLGYVAVLLGKGFIPRTGQFLSFFTMTGWTVVLCSSVALLLAWGYFSQRSVAVVPSHEIA